MKDYVPTFTVEDVVDTVRDVAAGDPEHIYSPDEFDPMGRFDIAACEYVHTKTARGFFGRLWQKVFGKRLHTGCLIGAAFIELGVPKQVLRDQCQGSTVGSALRKLNVPSRMEDDTVDYRQRRWLDYVQSLQDDETPWGKCVEAADIASPINPEADGDLLDDLGFEDDASE